MSIYTFQDYRAFLNHQIKVNSDRRGYQSLLAEAARCQRSLISQVLKSKGDLTRDHAAELSHFWGLDENETEYFVSLVDLSKAGSQKLKAHIEKRIRFIRSRSKQLSEKYRETHLDDPAAEAAYYSAWHWSAIHMLLGIKEFRDPVRIAERLQLPISLVQNVLSRLQAMKLVEKSGNTWKQTNQMIHLPSDSSMNSVNASNWRERAVVDSRMGSDDSLHYTSVFTISKKDYGKLQELLAKAIKNAREITVPSADEELASINIDLFRV